MDSDDMGDQDHKVDLDLLEDNLSNQNSQVKQQQEEDEKQEQVEEDLFSHNKKHEKFQKIKQTLNQLNDEYDILRISGMQNIDKSELAQNRKIHTLFDFRELECPPEKYQKTMDFLQQLCSFEHKNILDLKNFSMQFQQKVHGKPFIKFLMIYERIQYTYDDYYRIRRTLNQKFSEAELMHILLQLFDLQVYLRKNGIRKSTFHLKDYVITKNYEMKLFLIPQIKKPRTNKIVIQEYRNMLKKTNGIYKFNNVQKRFGVAKNIQDNEKQFIELNSMRYNYISPEVFLKYNFSAPGQSKINSEKSLIYSLGMMMLDMSLFKKGDLTVCYTKYNLQEDVVEKKLNQLRNSGFSEIWFQLLCKMLDFNPKQRMTIDRFQIVINDQYFKDRVLDTNYKNFVSCLKQQKGRQGLFVQQGDEDYNQKKQNLNNDEYLNNVNEELSQHLSNNKNWVNKLFPMPQSNESDYKDNKKMKDSSKIGEFQYLGKFSGDMNDQGLPHGAGIFIFLNGEKYEGLWENGKFNGIGRYYWPNGMKYYGEFKNDLMHGFGVCYYLEGGIYQGFWKNGKTDGEGTYSWQTSQARFRGYFAKDRIAGQGILKLKDGSYFEGNWKDWKYQGIQIKKKSFQ